MVSIHEQSKTCFVFPDGEGGFKVVLCAPSGKPLEYPLTLRRAAHLQEGLSKAIAALAKAEALAVEASP